MNHSLRLLRWLLVLAQLAWLGGCSSYQRVALPGQLVTEGNGHGRVASPEFGDDLRLCLQSGEMLQGMVIRLDDKTLTLKLWRDFDYQEERVVSRDEIRWATMRTRDSRQNAILWISAGAVAVIVWLGYMFIHGLETMTDG